MPGRVRLLLREREVLAQARAGGEARHRHAAARIVAVDQVDDVEHVRAVALAVHHQQVGERERRVAQDVGPDLRQLGLHRRRLHDRGAERLEQPRGALAGALADAADDARQRPDLVHEAVGGDPLRHVGDEHVLAGREAALLLEVAGHEVGRARARRSSAGRAAGRRAARGSRSSSTERMSPMSISMCESVGVPSVSTIASEPAGVASPARRRRASTRASSSSVPGSLNGIRRDRTASSRSGSLSTPSTRSPASANASASGRPTRPRPMTETSYTAAGI